MKRKKILISGSYGTGNCGDEIILHQILNLIRNDYDIILSSQGVKYSKKHFPGLYAYIDFASVWELKRILGDLVKFRWGEIAKRLRFIYWIWQCDIFWLGGGGLLSETVITVLKGYLQQVKLASWIGKNVIIFDIGVGPLRTEQGKENLYHTLLPWKEQISVRDVVSLEHLHNCGISEGPLLMPDPAFAYPIAKQKTVKRKKIIVNVYRLFTNTQLWPDGDRKRDEFEQALLSFLQILIDQQLDILFLPFGTQDDYYYGQELMQKLSSTHCAIIEKDLGYQQIVDQFQYSYCSITMRFHAGLLSMCANVPSICIDAQFKSERLLQDMQLDSLLLIPFSAGIAKKIVNDISSDLLLERFEQIDENYSTVQRTIKNYVTQKKEEYLHQVEQVVEVLK